MKGAALVTGGAVRIGAAIARRLAREGYAVGVHAHRSIEKAEFLAAELRAGGLAAVALHADLNDREAVGGLVGACEAALGPVRLLVNNAASFRYDDALGFGAADLDFHLRPNLEAPLLLARDVARALGAQEGAVVNMLDHKVAALNPDFFTYTVAKMGLEAATRMMAMAFGGRVRVNGVAPGITLISGKQTEAGFSRAWHAPPLGRSATPDELADAVVFAAETRALNGQVLVLDGGEGLVGRRRDIAFDTPDEGKVGGDEPSPPNPPS